MLKVLWGDIMANKKGELRIRILVGTTALAMFLTGFKLVNNENRKRELKEENARLRQEFQAMLDEELEQSHIAMKNNQNYTEKDRIEVGGRTIVFVDKEKEVVEPTLTPTPTPTEAPRRYIDTDSDEFIMAEDGVLHEREEVLKLYFTTEDEMIDFYTKVFQLDETAVGNKIYELIDEDRDAWENNNVLNGEEYDTKEQAIARTIADISNFPEDYGLEDIEVDEYKLDGYNAYELIYKFSDVIGVDPYIAEAIACGESGTELNSDNFQIRHNVGGLRRRTGDPHPATSWGLTIYKNEAEGLYRFVTILHDNFFVDEDSGYDRIVSMSSSYCEDGPYWRNLVGGIYYKLVDNGYDYYYEMYNDDRELIYPPEETEKTLEK